MKLQWLHKIGDGKGYIFVELSCKIVKVNVIARLGVK